MRNLCKLYILRRTIILTGADVRYEAVWTEVLNCLLRGIKAGMMAAAEKVDIIECNETSNSNICFRKQDLQSHVNWAFYNRKIIKKNAWSYQFKGSLRSMEGIGFRSTVPYLSKRNSRCSGVIFAVISSLRVWDKLSVDSERTFSTELDIPDAV